MVKKILGRMLIAAGVIMLALAAVLIYNNITEETQAGNLAAEDCSELMAVIQEREDEPSQSSPFAEDIESDENPLPEQEEVSGLKLPMNPTMEMPTENIKGNLYVGVLEFPEREIKLPVMSEWSYSKLRVAPCRYYGSVYSKDMVVCGHNYSRHFGKLKKMSVGEEILFTDVQGNVFKYSVLTLEIIEPTEVEKMTSGDWDLTLFTCTPGGKTRQTVRCRLTAYKLHNANNWVTE